MLAMKVSAMFTLCESLGFQARTACVFYPFYQTLYKSFGCDHFCDCHLVDEQSTAC
eukprot:m.184398 g.184398  ORF g.184398 m.184398 type:complete len:56 (+) comp14710_c2_seq23:1894-2061(+)